MRRGEVTFITVGGPVVNLQNNHQISRLTFLQEGLTAAWNLLPIEQLLPSLFEMIRLKQKKAEEEKKAAEEKKAEIEATAAPAGTTAPSSSAPDSKPTNGDSAADAGAGGGGLKLLGIGGKGARSGTVTKSAGKKRTPGEIRIQKGLFVELLILSLSYGEVHP